MSTRTYGLKGISTRDCGECEERLGLRVVRNEGLGVEHLLHKYEDQSSDPSSHVFELQVQQETLSQNISWRATVEDNGRDL